MGYGWGLDMMDSWDRPFFGLGFGLLAIWSVIWKGLALWRASREESKGWFIAILIFNTAGILEIIYLLFFAKEKLMLVTKPAKKSSSRKKK